MSLAGLLNTLCTIQKPSYGSPGDDGHPSVTYSTSATTNGRLVPGGGREFRINKQNVVAEYVLFLPGRLSIAEKDRVLIGSDTYDVLLVRNPSNLSHHLECALERVK